MKLPKPKIISFRDEIKDISNTRYLTHSLYYHPAKFIPQVVRYCLDNYCPPKGSVLDPFSGSGTTGLEASISGRRSYLTDINPLLNYFYTIKIPHFTLKEWWEIYKQAERLLEKMFITITSNIQDALSVQTEGLVYWYPPHLLSYFSLLWSKFYKMQSSNKHDKIVKNIIALILFKLSKKYSYAEHSMPKLFTSTRKKTYIDSLDNKQIIFDSISKEALVELKNINKRVSQLLSAHKIYKIKYFAGVDAYDFSYKKFPKVDCIITSPPYLQAQEYIRTFKLEMMWLGYSKNKIASFSKKEIPFRNPEGIIRGNYINNRRNQIERKDLLRIFDSYFWFTIKALENASSILKKNGKLCILIGNPKMNGDKVEIWKAIYEFFVKNLDYKFVNLFDDKIIFRKLFKGRKNKNPNGMKSEFLLVLNK